MKNLKKDTRKKSICICRTIKSIHLYRNGLGWLTLSFRFDERGHINEWDFTHLNEGPQYKILVRFLQIAKSFRKNLNGKLRLVSRNCRYDYYSGMISFDRGETWYRIDELSDSYTKHDGDYEKIISGKMEGNTPIKLLDNFIGKRVRLKLHDNGGWGGLRFRQDGSVSFNGRKFWFNIGEVKNNMVDAWEAGHRMGVI